MATYIMVHYTVLWLLGLMITVGIATAICCYLHLDVDNFKDFMILVCICVLCAFIYVRGTETYRNNFVKTNFQTHKIRNNFIKIKNKSGKHYIAYTEWTTLKPKKEFAQSTSDDDMKKIVKVIAREDDRYTKIKGENALITDIKLKRVEVD